MALLFPATALGFASTPNAMCASEEPPPKYMGPVDYTISAFETDCTETEINCYNRYSPHIPMNLMVESGSVVAFKTRDLWDEPGWDKSDTPDDDFNFDKA